MDEPFSHGSMSQGSAKIRLGKARRLFCFTLLFGARICCPGAQEKIAMSTVQPEKPWSVCASIAVKEAFDENVFLQNATSNAFHHSFVTSVSPTAGVSFKPDQAFNATLSYSPAVTFFHSEPNEDFSSHRVQLAMEGAASETRWEVSDTFLAIDGSNSGPTFSGPGGAPAAGAPQIRDRRDAMLERGQARVTQRFGSWFVRPVISGYYQDFQTLQSISPGYQNYVDRSDWNAGADVGKTICSDTSLTIGYRYGQQTQARLLDFPEHYNNSYHRVLFGLEGKPARWITLSLSAGPEFRHYGNAVAATFNNRDELIPFVDASVTFGVGTRDTAILSAKVFEQPRFSGRSSYVDSTYEMNWRHRFGEKLSVGVGVRAYNTEFLKPANRDDWIVTPSVVAAYTFNRHLSAEVSWLFDDAFSLVQDTEGREYTRNAVSLGVKYAFK
jgi:hypothetical protein